MLSLACLDFLKLCRTADIAAAMSVEALLGTDTAFDAAVQALRPHVGQREILGSTGQAEHDIARQHLLVRFRHRRMALSRAVDHRRGKIALSSRPSQDEQVEGREVHEIVAHAGRAIGQSPVELRPRPVEHRHEIVADHLDAGRREVVQADGEVGVVPALEQALVHVQGVLVQRLGVPQLALVPVQCREVVQTSGDVGVVMSLEQPPVRVQCVLAQWLGVRVITLGLVQCREVAQAGGEAVIPSTRSRSQAIPYDRYVYQERNLVERFFNKIKHFRRIAMRYEKTAISFASMLFLVGAVIWLR